MIQNDLVSGGKSSENVALSKVEKYDPLTRQWVPILPMPSERSEVGVAVCNGKVYVVGGFNDDFSALVEFFDYTLNSWTEVASIPQSTSSVSAVFLGDNLYVCGGECKYGVTNAVHVFHRQENRWASGVSMLTKRYFAAVAVLDGCIYIMGGSDGTSSLSSVERFSPDVGEWEKVTAMQSQRSSCAAAVLNGKIYVCGGLRHRRNHRVASASRCYANPAYRFVFQEKSQECLYFGATQPSRPSKLFKCDGSRVEVCTNSGRDVAVGVRVGFYWSAFISDYDATPDFVVKLKKTLESPFFYNTEGPTLNYDDGGPELFNLLMRSSVTKLGCVWVTCSADFNFYGLMTFYCLTNQSPPGLKDPIYEVGTGVCSGCPQGTFCEAGSKLCARTLSAPPGERIFKGFKCRNSLIAEEWRRKMLNVHNDNRRKLAKGSQRGEGGAPLPTAKNMNQLIWDCSLEDVAYEQAVKCTESVTPPAGYGAVSSMIWTKAKPCNAWNKTVQAVKDIWRAGSTKQASHKKVAGNDDFSQMAYYKTSGIGCSYSWCTGRLSLVCVYNKDGAAASVKKLYTKGGAGDTCKSCEPNKNQKNCVDGLCDVSLPYVPSISTICPRAFSSFAVWLTDDLRTIALDMHNYYRRLLAMGWAKDKQITYAKTAAAMPELTYDCGIEELIMGGLIDCAGKPVATKRLQTYSFYVFKPYNAPVEEALQKVIERWWSPLAEKGIPDNKYHEGEELENYVNIASSQTRKVGCGISACYRKGWIEIQCGYGMDEYIDDGDDIYEAGKTCRNCAKLKPAMRCSRLGGLCVPWGRSLF
ncbi:hypothetical protein Y032_0011g1329 [Ancylostoma ceylanicum]|nr:hypothetical protein Y032_0011g1329 [Ancylostoma ceylanicum]